MEVSRQEVETLRKLALQIAEIAGNPAQEETKALWRAHNGLHPQRPMVVIDQICWNELEEDSLRCVVKDPFFNHIERKLRRTIYQWKHMPADMVVAARIDIPMAIETTGFGLTPDEDLATTDPTSDVLGHAYKPQIKNPEDIEKIKTPKISLNTAENEARYQWAKEIFGNILPVHMAGGQPWFGMWDRLVELMGVEEVLVDLIDRPEFIHEVCRRWTDAALSEVDQYEALGLLDPSTPTIHCSFTNCDELPHQVDHRPLASDMWTCGMAQIFSSVSPAMHDEFECTYAREYYARFGLVNYGCCEPLDRKITIIKKLPHIRKISISPWADPRRAAPLMGSEYIMARKPNPAFLAGSHLAVDQVTEDIKNTLSACQENHTPVEFILKDISTLSYQPQRLF